MFKVHSEDIIWYAASLNVSLTATDISVTAEEYVTLEDNTMSRLESDSKEEDCTDRNCG